MVPSVRNLLSDAQTRIASALDMPVQEARIEAQILMRVALGNLNRAQLILSDSQTPSPVQAEQFFAMLERRLAGEPVAYILGKREFYGLEFLISVPAAGRLRLSLPINGRKPVSRQWMHRPQRWVLQQKTRNA